MLEYFALVMSFISLAVSVWNINRSIWGSNISQSRNTWINEFRDEISSIVRAIRICKDFPSIMDSSEKYSEEYFKCILEAEKARARLLTKLNTSTISGNLFNFPLNDILIEIDFTKPVEEDTIFQINYLTKNY